MKLKIINNIYRAWCRYCGEWSDSDMFSDACPRCGAKMYVDVPKVNIPKGWEVWTLDDLPVDERVISSSEPTIRAGSTIEVPDNFLPPEYVPTPDRDDYISVSGSEV